MKSYEIFYIHDKEVVGTAVVLEDGDLSISIQGAFVGVYPNLRSWDSTGNYDLRPVPDFLSQERKGDIYTDLDDLSLEDDWVDSFTLDFSEERDLRMNPDGTWEFVPINSEQED